MKTFRSYSSDATTEFGEKLARKIRDAELEKLSGRDGAVILALQGDLGAGKTTFTQGFAHGLGVKRRTASPTFVIMRRFAIPLARSSAKARFKNFYHIDAYRLKKLDSLEQLGLMDIFTDPTAVVLIEWPEKIKKVLPRGAKITWLKFRYGKKENERIIGYY
jgi:tRNA threonylcarbamoyladenosine biosynthesis protein TsaE